MKSSSVRYYLRLAERTLRKCQIGKKKQFVVLEKTTSFSPKQQSIVILDCSIGRSINSSNSYYYTLSLIVDILFILTVLMTANFLRQNLNR